MILTGLEIAKQVGLGKIKISNFDPARCTTNSYDLSLGPQLVSYEDEILDPKKEHKTKTHLITPDGFILNKSDFYLGETCEMIGSDHFVPIIHAKSGTARRGLFVHVTADLIDLGWHGKPTLQLYATLPAKIYENELIAQVSFWVPKGEITLYKGKYMPSDGPMASKAHLDYKKD